MEMRTTIGSENKRERKNRAHFCPRSNLKMNLGITFSGNWQGPNTLLPRVIKTGRLYERMYAFVMNSAAALLQE